ncbi:cell wall hydrolase [Benzoatithermus flavus]|uniref:Cell wall hydrolase n=1 Tax=Benzoatithermus flavus TaxID=3108223 RepID=A0ABU8XTP4_9PROT
MRRPLAAALACVFAIVAPMAARAGADEPDPRAVQALALTMYHEAKGEGRKGMLAVGWVVLNRMADESFPKTVQEIVYQGCQFSWVCNGEAGPPTERGAWRQALALAERLLKEPPADPTHGALWFNGADVGHTVLGDKIAASTQIGRHLFYARADRLPRPQRKPYGAVMWASR